MAEAEREKLLTELAASLDVPVEVVTLHPGASNVHTWIKATHTEFVKVAHAVIRACDD